jgi:hypothetical protein
LSSPIDDISLSVLLPLPRGDFTKVLAIVCPALPALLALRLLPTEMSLMSLAMLSSLSYGSLLRPTPPPNDIGLFQDFTFFFFDFGRRKSDLDGLRNSE